MRWRAALSALAVVAALCSQTNAAGVGTLGSRFSRLGSGTAALGPNLANYLLYDPFTGPAGAALNGRVPPKGPTWQASGGGAPNAIAGAGLMTQTVNGQALYAFSQFGQVPRRYSCKWNYPSGTVNLPATYAIATGNSLSTNFLHGEMGTTNFFIRLGLAPTPTFIIPAWFVSAPNYTLSSGVEYQSELDYDGGTNASMIVRNANTGAVIGSETVHDPQMASYAGNWTFAESQDNLLQYNNCFAQATTAYPFPTLNILQETTFPTNASGWIGDPGFGGTVTYNGAGSMSITGTSFPQGGSFALSSLTSGDVVWATVDVSAQPTTNGAWAIVDVSGSVISNGGTPYAFPAGTGRFQQSFAITTSSASPRLLITANPGPLNVTLSQSNVYKNPPTSPPTPPAYP